MKKFYPFIILLNLLFLVSCSNSDPVVQKQAANIDYAKIKLGVVKKLESVKETFNEEKKTKSLVAKYVGIRKIPSLTSGVTISNEFKVNFPSHYNKEEKRFLLNFYNKLANTNDDKIIDLISVERNSFRLSNFSASFKNEVDLIYFITELSATTILEIKQGNSEILLRQSGGGFWDCITAKVTGKDVGRNLVMGFVGGAIAGAKIGAAGGTVALPGVGTVTGGVAGAVFGGTSGAIGGVAAGYVWPAIDCITTATKFEEKYLTDDFFIDEMPLSRFTSEEIETWNTILNTPEIITFTEQI